MDNTIDAPATNSGRMLKTSEGRERSLSEERVKFMEEECDDLQFLCGELSTWLSTLSGKEIDSDLLTSLRDGIVGDQILFQLQTLCEIFHQQLPSIPIDEYHEKGSGLCLIV